MEMQESLSVFLSKNITKRLSNPPAREYAMAITFPNIKPEMVTLITESTNASFIPYGLYSIEYLPYKAVSSTPNKKVTSGVIYAGYLMCNSTTSIRLEANESYLTRMIPVKAGNAISYSGSRTNSLKHLERR